MAACSTYQYDAIFIIENLIASGEYERVCAIWIVVGNCSGCVCFIISGLTFVKSEWAHNY